MSENIVSIIVCSYNQESTIGRTLDGILQQKTKLPYEIIVGDDCSQDGTIDICRQYQQRYPDIIRLIAHPINLGVVENYYNCVREAKGEYIMECGGDDEWCPGRINLCIDIMEKHPNVVQIFTDVFFKEDKTGRIWEVHSSSFQYGLLKGTEVIEAMFHQRHNQLISYAMTRKSAILILMDKFPQFFSGRRYLAEDKQLKTLLGTIGDFYYTNHCTYYYTVDNSSITHSSNSYKIYNYNKNMLLLTHDLAKALHYNTKKLTDIYSDISYCMLTRVFLTCDISLRNELVELLKEYGIIPHGKNRLLLMLMKNSFVWHLALSCYLLTIDNK